MKTIWKIAKTELQSLFYSPIAWLVLVIFFIQCAVNFNNTFGSLVTNMELYGRANNATDALFISQFTGMFPKLQSFRRMYKRHRAHGNHRLRVRNRVTNRRYSNMYRALSLSRAASQA